jgi:amino acid adenylation domain-containing protein
MANRNRLGEEMQETIAGYRLSPQQERVWRLSASNREAAYRSGCVVSIEGQVSSERIAAALETVINRHEILRTGFDCLPGMSLPLQVIQDKSNLLFEQYDLTAYESAEQQTEIEALLRVERQRESHQLEPAFRAALVSIANNRRLLLLNLPALWADAASVRNLVQEIGNCCGAELDDAGLSADVRQYADVSEVFNELLEAEEMDVGQAYWKRKQLPGFTTLRLPVKEETPRATGFEPHYESLTFDADVAEEIRALARKCEANASAVLLACWLTLIWRLTQRTGIIIGIACDGRNYEGLEHAMGPFARFVPLDYDLAEEDSFLETVRRADQAIRDSYQWQEYFAWNQSSPVASNMDAAAFFPVCYEFDEHNSCYAFGPLRLSISQEYACIDRFNIKLRCILEADRLRAEMHYDSTTFSATTVNRLGEEFRSLLGSALTQPAEAIGRLEILSAGEQQRLLVEFNETGADYPSDSCVNLLIEKQTALTPHNIAVIYEDRQLSYEQLNARANQVGRYLGKFGVGPDELVGLFLERSPEMVIGLLGILKAGSAYLPLDAAYPRERLQYMLADARVRVVLTHQKLFDEIGEHEGTIICLDTDWETISSESEENLEAATTAENLAYVIYTSGSSGQPKGVMVPHRGLVNYLSWCTRAYPINEGCGTLVHSPIGFDLTITSLLPPLLVGKSVTLLPENESIEGLSRRLRRGGDFSLLKITPAHLDVLSLWLPEAEAEGKSRALIIGGEALVGEKLTSWQQRAPGTKLINEYGPTETVVGCCVYEVSPGKRISGGVPIGRPIQNMQLYILDKHLKPVAGGATGELYISGDGLARGYLRRPHDTAARFIANPFSQRPGARMYRTGDLARFLEDDNIEFLGRNDDQVKIRGYRVELGEIEAALRQNSALEDAVVVTREDTSGERKLVAYVVGRQGQELVVPELRNYLRAKLPSYMEPAIVVVLQALPLTPNGKVDRHALPEPDGSRPELEVPYIEPRNERERFIADVWRDVLGLERVGVNDNFFDLGGHSLMLFHVHSKLRQGIGRELLIVDLFQHTTVGSLAQFLMAEPGAKEEFSFQQINERVNKQKHALKRHKQLVERSRSRE